MKKIITIAAVFFLSLSLNAQYYYYQGEKIYLTERTDKMFIKLSENADKQKLLSIINADDSVKLSADYKNSLGLFAVLDAKESINISSATVNKYRNNPNIVSAQLMLEYKNMLLSGLIDEFIVKLKPTTSLKQLQGLMSDYSCVIIEESPYVDNEYLISVSKTSALDAMQTANAFFETGLFEFSTPNFVAINPFCSNDPYFGNQWGLQNSNLNPPHIGPPPKYGINAECAWEITQGNKNIKIAVVDDGVDLHHPDLEQNLLSGYSVYGWPWDVNGRHGTACAGIIGAVKDNGIGITGVAPDCKIVPVNAYNSYYGDAFKNSALVSAIYLAYIDGKADVISCSFAGFYDDGIANAINAAITNGRGGKGCVVVASAGNYEYNEVLFPASLPNVISVGAMSPCGERKFADVIYPDKESGLPPYLQSASCDGEWWGSCYGENLDVIAPGVLISTTDLQGDGGYNPNIPIHPNNHGTILTTDYSDKDYTVWFNGTSAACPFVSGVAALVLSVKPQLTWKQVKDIIESTAQKTRPDLYNYETTPGRPNGTWNEQTGYGLVDACEAVKKALQNSDLMIKDDPLDNGTEPNPNPISWNSPDIKITYKSTGEEVYPCKIDVNQKLLVNIKVRNIGDAPSPAGEKLSVHWGIPQLVQNFSNKCMTCTPIGGFYTTLYAGGIIAQNYLLPSIPARGVNGDGIFEVSFPFQYPLQDYVLFLESQLCATRNININWGFAILAGVIEQDNTNASMPPLPNVELFAKNSNNIAVDNGNTTVLFDNCFANVVMLEPEVVSGNTFVINYNQLLTGSNYTLNDFAELNAILSNNLMAKLNKKASKDIKLIDENTVLLTSTNSELVFNPLNDNGIYFIGAEVHFISDKMPEFNEFNFNITLSAAGQTLGTVPFTAVRDADVYFKAHAEASKTKIVRGKEEATLTSNTITDDATYTWLDEGKNIIGDGTQLTVSPSVGQNYTIEIQKEDDGFKSYGEVGVIVVDGVIKSLSPNPAQNNVTVNYLLADDVTNATIQIANIFGNVQVSLPLSTTQEQQDISLLGLVSGNYIVQLVINGFVVDSQSLIIK